MVTFPWWAGIRDSWHLEQILHADLDQESEENLKMAAIVKAERDEAQKNLAMTLSELDGLTEVNHLVVSMGRAQIQFEMAKKRHIVFCILMEEDSCTGAHLEWSNALGDLFSACCDKAEEKLKALAEDQLELDIIGLIDALELEHEKIGEVLHKFESMEEAINCSVEDLGASPKDSLVEDQGLAGMNEEIAADYPYSHMF